MEEGFMLYFPERMSRGDVPNVDFLHLYGPGSLHVLMGWYELFGNTLVAERTFGLVQHVAIILGLFTLARPWGRVAATLVGAFAVFYVLTPIGLTAMAWNGGLALTLWCAVCAVRSTYVLGQSRLYARLAAGALGGLALDVSPGPRARRGGGARLVGLERAGLVALSARRTGRWVDVDVGPSRRGRTTGGVAGHGCRPRRAPAGGPRVAATAILGSSRRRVCRRLLSPNRHGGGFPTSARRRRSSCGSGRCSPALWALLTLAVIEHRRGRRDGRADRLADRRPGERRDPAPGVPAARFDAPHVGDVRVLAVRRRRRRRRRPTPLAAHDDASGRDCGAVVTLLFTFVLTSLFTFRHYLLHTRAGFGLVPQTFEISRDDRTFYFGAPRAALASQQLINDLDGLALPGDRLFVGPADLSRTWYSDAVFYWMFPEMEPATYFIEMDPGLANADDSGLADDLASADFVITTSFWNGWREPNASMDFGFAGTQRGARRQLLPVPPVPGRPRPPLLPLPLGLPPHSLRSLSPFARAR